MNFYENLWQQFVNLTTSTLRTKQHPAAGGADMKATKMTWCFRVNQNWQALTLKLKGIFKIHTKPALPLQKPA